MKKLLVILFLTVSFSGFSQKVKLKKGDVIVDDVAWLKYDGCGGMFDRACSLLSSTGDELIFMKWISVKGAEPSTSSNPEGTLTYVEVSFLGTNTKFEIKDSQKDIIALLYRSKVVGADGKLDVEKSQRVVEKYGTEFSDRLNGGSKQTIIIKEEPKRSGININIGN